MKVLKFGGTSVGSVNSLNNVIKIIGQQAQHDKLVVVVSAVGGITDRLMEVATMAINKDPNYTLELEAIKTLHLDIINGLISNGNTSRVIEFVSAQLNRLEKLLDGLFLINELSPKTTDKLLSFGELLSSYIISEALVHHALDAKLKNAQELIVTDSQHTKAEVDLETTHKNIEHYFKESNEQITVVPGFIARSKAKEFTTLGRGGSDYTAALIAAAINASELQIWTDVSGMFTTNPKLVKQALPIKQISYQEAVELSHFGAKVLYPPTVQPVLNKNIPILIKNTWAPDDEGTAITNNASNGNTSPVKGISNINNIALLTLQGNGMVGIPGFSKRLFETLAQEKINIILITQASSEHSICFGIDENEAIQAKSVIDKIFENEIALNKIDPILIEAGLAIIAIVGDNMKSHQGISGKMFSALGKNNVNIRAIAQGASERNISAVIESKDVKKALNTIHERFFEIKTKQVNLFITGVGNVGERLLEQIQQQRKFVKEQHKVNIRIVGISNSRTMHFDDDGISLKNWQDLLKNGEKASLEGFLAKVKSLNLRNSIFVDITASESVAAMYSNYLKENIAVVACNKIAGSSDYKNYNELKYLSRKYNAPFLFETNVGAGLPVIDTLNHLITSGDKINTIQAVLSGSLNFVFNNFNGETRFHDVVKQAQDEGYTEPDPRVDLSGIDVARKILILARESGIEMNLEQIKTASFLTEDAMSAPSVDAFYQTLVKNESHYQDLYESAKQKNCQLKFVAEFSNGEAQVGLQEIPEGHPFYNLKGKDNIVMFYTERYPENPMIIKGAGAGAEVTASGLFADIMRIANN
ncbi:MAG: bifunctional aspartate kinase/homoserine dehydrogenase I [Bacteroidia bacterium]|nr:bifunctional aspartate kinase/homoserine dehydrogenase I [Bacteroidia bacterium]NND25556.1 bifunctional aspartate kinase/homoserine dehydrogenase I [Flavobacteriaceae bacterium]NNK60546.1 bifunctional aspartate kinase/homoserine dehydrogenase I [Flavobacteriaceae bacterium]NNL31608.1 bifunctional aspartate kinase/homoserine dehydrogenase I [Flavobacteriaceae bacterium]RZW56901.1 MAG: bifunctional aspartate kinase/homoserine dehydrogenase I [Flavobacteriaceae bacterium]